MESVQQSAGFPEERAIRVLQSLLPRSAEREVLVGNRRIDLIVGEHELEVKWVGEGNLNDVRRALGQVRGDQVNIFVGRQFSPGALEAMSEAGVGWMDETGAAEVAFGSIIISRSGRPPAPVDRSLRWTPAVLGVSEALLCGTKPTVSEVQSATGLSTGSCVYALGVLAGLGLLEADARRGRGSGRRVGSHDQLLNAYAAEASAANALPSLPVGALWKDPIAGLIESGHYWDKSGVRWASTGLTAAAVMAPYLTTVSTTEVYVDAKTVVGLESAALDVGLRPIEGGRLTLKPFPTSTTRELAFEVDGLRVAPWPRVFVDLRSAGVRGEEAAEHLREVMHAS
jgi:hypothetical protein